MYVDFVHKFARVEKAKFLLTTTSDPIRDIVYQLQFCSSGYFAQTFQQITGLTPYQWREQEAQRFSPDVDTKGHSPG